MELMILDLNTNELTPVPGSQSLVSNAQLSWSPDGRYLAVESVERDTPFQDVVLIEVGSWDRKTIAQGDEPSWSPKGDWIAYLANQYETCVVVHPEGTGAKALLDFRRRLGGWDFSSALVWSPDGTRLLLNEEQIDGHHYDVKMLDLVGGANSRKSKDGEVVFGWISMR